MTDLQIMVLGNIIRTQVEVEAMKWDNHVREIQGLETFNYSASDFWDKANEIQGHINQLFK